MRFFLLIAVLALGSTSCSRTPRFPDTPSAFKGLSCEVSEDDRHFPDLHSTNLLGIPACLGYAHGRYRFWQMSHFRRIAEGRLAEIEGFSRLKTDYLMRMLGLRERADRLYEELSPSGREYLEAYAAGVNQGAKEAVAAGEAYEFRERNESIRPWLPADALLVLLLQSFDQTRKSFEQEIKETKAWARYGDSTPQLFSPDGLPWDTSILKEGEAPLAPPTSRRSARAPHTRSEERDPRFLSALHLEELWEGFSQDRERGSNNWVIAPARSATGKAWLANDPHLDLKTPPYWHWMSLRTPEVSTLGGTLPGVPLIISGASTRVAWGLTNAFLDVADVSWLPENELTQRQTRRPWVWVRWGPFSLPIFFKTIQLTQEGWPILPLQGPRGHLLVLRWSGFDLRAAELEPLFHLLEAKSAVEFDSLLERIGLPTWNFVFADVKGQIGFRAVGKIPRREKAPSWGVPQGQPLDWTYLEPSQNPHLLAPQRGYIATANNRQWPAGSALHGGRAYAEPFRAFRIEELLRARPRHDLRSLAEIQCDVQSVDARWLLKPLTETLNRTLVQPTPSQARVLEALLSWDLRSGLDSTATAPYRLWIETLRNEQSLSIEALYRLLTRSEDLPEFSKKVAIAFESVVRSLGGEDEKHSLAPWSHWHQATFPHFGGELLTQHPPLPTPGDQHSVNLGNSEWDGFRFQQATGASHRLLVELTDPPRVYVTLAGDNRDIRRPDPRFWKEWQACKLSPGRQVGAPPPAPGLSNAGSSSPRTIRF